MGAAESTPQGIQKSTDGTKITIDCALVEQHLQTMATLKSDLEAANTANDLAKQKLEEIEQNKKLLQDKLNKSMSELIKNFSLVSESEKKRKEAEETVLILREKNEILKKKNENIQLQEGEFASRVNDFREKLNQVTQELQTSKNKFKENNEMWNTKHGKLNSQYSKVQSELQKYKSNKNVHQLVELQLQLQKLTSQIDSATKKFTKEAQNKNRPISEAELEKIKRTYEENMDIFVKLNITLEKQNFPVMLKTYRDLCQKNDQKILDAMKSIYDVNKQSKSLSEIAKTEIPKTLQKATSLTETYTKEIEALKQKTFFNDFKQEEKLYTDLLPALEEIRIFSNSVPNNLNTSTCENSVLNSNSDNPSCSQDMPILSDKNNKKKKKKSEEPEKPSSVSNNLNTSTLENSVLNFNADNSSCSQDMPKASDKNNKKKKNKNKNEEPEKPLDLLRGLEDMKIFSKGNSNNLNVPASEDNLVNFNTDDPSCSHDIPKFSAKNNNKKKNKSKIADPEKPSPAGWNFNVFDNETKNYSVILYDFPENTLSGAEHDAVDLINIKYFLGKLDLGDIENITVQRLPIADSGNIRPVVVNLSNMDAVQEMLSCAKKLPEMGLQNVKIAKFSGKM